MPYELIWEPEGVLNRLSGVVSAREFIRSIEKIQGAPQFSDVEYVISDFSDVAGHEIGEATLAHLAAFHFGVLAYHPNCRMIFVTSDPNFNTLLTSTLKSSHISSYPVEVLATLTEARDWLDSQPDPNLQSVMMSLRGMYPPEG
jgi:hypothetical protein